MGTGVLSTGDKILNMMKDMDMSIPGLAALSGIRENTLLDIMAGIREPDIERVSYVLANTIMHRRQEERISPENKEWAMSIEPYAMYESRDIVAASHPAVLNGFINQTRRYIRHEKELAAQAKAERAQEPEQNNIADVYGGELVWHIVHEMDDDNGQPTEWSAKLPDGEFLWIDKETEGYALYDTYNTDASPVSVSETLDGASASILMM